MDSDADSLELDMLAAELRVSQLPALPARRNMGGTDISDGRALSEESQGMFTAESVNLETASDMEYETSPPVDMPAGVEPVNIFGQSDVPKTTMTKKSCIYVVPTDIKEYNKVCFNLISVGAVFCIGTNCTVSHRGGAIMTVERGDIFVAKSSSEAFVEPRMSSLNIDEQALQDWKDASLSFEDWSKKFLMATATGDGKPASKAAMEVQENLYRNQALTFKTPAKRKRDLDEEALELVTDGTW
jgi:hypothetical protein